MSKALHFKEKIQVNAIGLTMPLVDYIPDSEGLISYQARVSNEGNQLDFDTADGLLAYCARNGHWSIFDMANLVLEIKAPRDISRQVLRHSSAKFQEFCIAGESRVYTDKGYTRIDSLHAVQKAGGQLPLAKVFDEETKEFCLVPIKEVFDTGLKEVYKVTTKNNRTINTTLSHKFLTKDSFKELGDLSIGDLIGTNGIPCYQNEDWLSLAKEESIKNKGGLSYIAEKAGVTTHTIRKWLKRNNLQFTKQEVASYTPIWNKGIPMENQPRFGKLLSEETRGLMRKSATKGECSNLWRGGVVREGRQEIWDWQHKYRNKLMKMFNNTCALCKKKGTLEIDHIKPVKSYPELSKEFENLQVLCKDCHQSKSNNELVTSPNFSEVVSIEMVGVVQTYDLEVDHVSHNYVANGIVTHNSQRYADVTDDMFCLRDMRMQDTKNRQNSLADSFSAEQEEEWYKDQQEIIDKVQEVTKKWRSREVAKECTRVFMPEGLTMSNMYMNGTVRTWIHYAGLRTERGVTQDEHCDVADKCREYLMKYFPSLTKVLEGETK